MEKIEIDAAWSYLLRIGVWTFCIFYQPIKSDIIKNFIAQSHLSIFENSTLKIIIPFFILPKPHSLLHNRYMKLGAW